jgi:hypothetical protein
MGGRGSSSSRASATNRVERGGVGPGGTSTAGGTSAITDANVRSIIGNRDMHLAGDAKQISDYAAASKLTRQMKTNLRETRDGLRWSANHARTYAKQNPGTPGAAVANAKADEYHALAERANALLTR